MGINVNQLRADFPAIAANSGVIYFDNACTALKPKPVIQAMNDYYSNYPACAGRSNHRMSQKVDEALHSSREKIQKFLNCKPDSLIFTRNTTEGLNLVAEGFDYSKRKKVVISNMEHHSLLLPFQRLAQAGKINLEFVKADTQGLFNIADWQQAIDSSTALVAVHHTTNTTGVASPLKEIVKIAHDAGAKVLIDGAQGAAHAKIDIQKEGFDFFAFSGHKMAGPTGIGCLAANPDALASVRPLLIGGETIKTATLTSHVPLIAPKRYEAGIQNYSGIIGLGATVDYLQKIGMENIASHEQMLVQKAYSAIQDAGATIYGPIASKRSSGIVAFNLPSIKHHTVSGVLDRLAGVAVRSGYFCAQPACEHMGAKDGAVRASFYMYNTEDEVKRFGDALSQVKQLA